MKACGSFLFFQLFRADFWQGGSYKSLVVLVCRIMDGMLKGY